VVPLARRTVRGARPAAALAPHVPLACRNLNNDSVRRSRQKKRQDRRAWETQGSALQQHNEALQQQLGLIRAQLSTLAAIAEGGTVRPDALHSLAPLFRPEDEDEAAATLAAMPASPAMVSASGGAEGNSPAPAAFSNPLSSFSCT
jgi:hypothetical protein